MPIGHLIEEKSSTAQNLLERLIAEWKTPHSNGNEPVLIEQSNPRRDGSRYVYVIWTDWSSLRPIERSEIIMEAYAATHTAKESLRVTSISGFTPEEASERGIRYTTEGANGNT